MLQSILRWLMGGRRPWPFGEALRESVKGWEIRLGPIVGAIIAAAVLAWRWWRGYGESEAIGALITVASGLVGWLVSYPIWMAIATKRQRDALLELTTPPPKVVETIRQLQQSVVPHHERPRLDALWLVRALCEPLPQSFEFEALRERALEQIVGWRHWNPGPGVGINIRLEQFKPSVDALSALADAAHSAGCVNPLSDDGAVVGAAITAYGQEVCRWSRIIEQCPSTPASAIPTKTPPT